MKHDAMRRRIAQDDGFVAALDQSGGSSPKALAAYGIAPDAYASEEEMFSLIHAMRCRVLNAPSFSGDAILGAILFERTMKGGDGKGGRFVDALKAKGIVPFLKVDKGLEKRVDGVQLMKPIPDLPQLCADAREAGVFGTKMRSVIHAGDPDGIAAAVRQQMDFGLAILDQGLVPILEPEINLECEDREAAEHLLLSSALEEMERVPDEQQVLWKLSIPVKPDMYRDLQTSPKVMRVLALSGGYSRAEACLRLAAQPGMIASFSRALLEGLHSAMTDEEFDRHLARSLSEICAASSA